MSLRTSCLLINGVGHDGGNVLLRDDLLWILQNHEIVGRDGGARCEDIGGYIDFPVVADERYELMTAEKAN